ncbi:hypothetical protein HMPREF1574_00184 [Gardnerella pickettii JCP7659]|uniref:ABC-three component system middle component 7 n=1 Tax=Gardnerella TaxID=2701 RepID=UPI0001D424E3|nr:ABC-three component system middle component 7 [Gardnerella pickettii]EFH27669.1 hypothetical protein GVAMD_0736 [Gardnerella vaginalis AMD]EPI56094.1 hypothetical protein HMPREF1574_00184 [Gardnerella pickettii JCP7659]
MELPNKLYPYEKSTLATLPVVLEIIRNGKTDIRSIFQSTLSYLDEPSDFLSVMDCLYALNAIEMTDEGKVKLCL